MKKVLSIVTIAAFILLVMAACNNKPEAANTPLTNPVVTYQDTAGFAQFQAWKAMNERTDPNAVFSTNEVASKPVAPKKVYRSSNRSGSMASSSTNTAMVSRKKGWSKSAKYSVIGGGAGAVLGALINKRNRVAGGIIGGVLGGGIGYGVGRSQDKKDGRF